jgi:hypothetical protein
MLPAVLLLGLGFAALDRIGPFSRLPSVSSICHLPPSGSAKTDRSLKVRQFLRGLQAGVFVSWIAFCFCSINEKMLNLITSTEGRLGRFFLCFLEQRGLWDSTQEWIECALLDTRHERPVLCAYTPVGLWFLSLCLLRWIVDRRWFFSRGTRWER